jgi:DNA-directed RNA polymerase subunit M/transcription elongation factor TFIIS
MEFCPMCKNILVPGEWRGKNVGKCSCGFIRTSGFVIEHESKNIENALGAGVIEKSSGAGFDFICKKCGFDKAEAKELGEILGNEKSVTLFTCLSCGSVERK